jgi:large subunit ribosomal protein L7Ae
VQSAPYDSKKAVAAAPAKAVQKKKKTKKPRNPLFEKKTRNFGIGNDLRQGRDLTRYVKWPHYIKLQRQRAVLYARLKIPPAINQFSRTLDKNTATELFKLLAKYRPEDRAAKKQRLLKIASEQVKSVEERKKEKLANKDQRAKERKERGKEEKRKRDEEAAKKPAGDAAAAAAAAAPAKKDIKKKDVKPKEAKDVAHPIIKQKKPRVLKYGINHITGLIEQKKAKLVVIANDVDPVELVVWLPALCRKMQVPYCIVKNKARLGALVHKKTATAVALVSVNKKDKNQFLTLTKAIKENYNDRFDEFRRQWGGGKLGAKSAHALAKKRKRVQKELRI